MEGIIVRSFYLLNSSEIEEDDSIDISSSCISSRWSICKIYLFSITNQNVEPLFGSDSIYIPSLSFSNPNSFAYFLA